MGLLGPMLSLLPWISMELFDASTVQMLSFLLAKGLPTIVFRFIQGFV